jgi:hypothetical protein
MPAWAQGSSGGAGTDSRQHRPPQHRTGHRAAGGPPAGQAAAVPVARLLGGPVRRHVRHAELRRRRVGGCAWPTTSPKTCSWTPRWARARSATTPSASVLPGGIFVNKTEKLSYYNVSAGYNLLPGEVFFGRGMAKPRRATSWPAWAAPSSRASGARPCTPALACACCWVTGFALQADVRDHCLFHGPAGPSARRRRTWK